MHSNVARLGVEGARDISECGTLVAIFLSSGPLSLRRNATKIRGRGLVADDFCLVIAYTSCIMHYGFEDELFLSWGGLDSNDIWSKPRSRPLNNLWQIEFEVSVEIFSFFFSSERKWFVIIIIRLINENDLGERFGIQTLWKNKSRIV